jgi:biotin transport system substrate-specific component
MASIQVGFSKGLSLGLTPFLAGDAIKIVAAAVLLPAAWKLVDRASAR